MSETSILLEDADWERILSLLQPAMNAREEWTRWDDIHESIVTQLYA